MNNFQQEIYKTIDILTGQKLSQIGFDRTKRGKVVSVNDTACVVEIDGEEFNCKLRRGIYIEPNDIVFVKFPQNNNIDKYVDTILGGNEMPENLVISAQEILDKLKTVDGHNSGLDADTLDGKHASELATLGDLDDIDVPTIKLSGDSQMIKQDALGNVTPSTSFNVIGIEVNATITRWLFSVNGGTFETGLPEGVTRSGNIVTINPEIVTFNTLSIRVEDGTLTDTFTIGRAIDGEKGDKGDEGLDGIDAITVVLTNESHTFAGDTTNAIPGSASTEFLAFKGVNRASVTIGDITGMPDGMNSTIDINNSQNAKVTFTVNTDMTSRSGIITIPLTVDGTTINKTFSYSLSLKGDKGESAYKVELVTSNGSVFKNGIISTIVLAKVYYGSEDITDEIDSNRFRWRRISNDPAGDSIWNDRYFGGVKEIEITRDDVNKRATFSCEILKE